MSLLTSVEEHIKFYKVHQAKINDSIQLYRGLLQSLTPNRRAGSEESDVADDAATVTDAASGEQVDIELLERALEHALRVRTSSEPPKNRPVKKDIVPQPKEGATAVKQSSGTFKGNPTFKSANRKAQKKPGMSMRSSVGSRPSSVSSNCLKPSKTTNNRSRNPPVLSAEVVHHTAVPGSGSADLIPPLLSKTIKNALSASDLRKTASVHTPSARQSGMVSSEQVSKWKSLRCKQNRLWDKVTALQRKPVVGRSRFMERMRTTFPEDFPRGCPNQTRAVVDRLTCRGREHLLLCRTWEVEGKQTSEGDAERDGGKNSSSSSWRHENLMRTAAEIGNSAAQVKGEWKAWDRWRPEGGCLCTNGANSVWGDGRSAAALPLTVTYTTEGELQELEELRMKVALLKQELLLEQALFDALSPQLSSIVPGPGCPDPSGLRDLYSLLGEGGEHYPAIVLDSQPD